MAAIVSRSSCTSTNARCARAKRVAASSRTVPRCRSRPPSACPAMRAPSRSPRTNGVSRSTSVARRAASRRRCVGRSPHATKAAFFPGAATNATSTGITSSIGRTAARPSSRTWSRCAGSITARCTGALSRESCAASGWPATARSTPRAPLRRWRCLAFQCARAAPLRRRAWPRSPSPRRGRPRGWPCPTAR